MTITAASITDAGTKFGGRALKGMAACLPFAMRLPVVVLP